MGERAGRHRTQPFCQITDILAHAAANPARGTQGVALHAIDQPSIDGVNTWFVSQAVASLGIKVALSGLGGDVPRVRRLAHPAANEPDLKQHQSTP